MCCIRCFTCRTRASVLLPTLKGLIKPTDSVLDVGCDTGIVTNYIKEKIGCKIVGTDFQNILEYNIPFVSYYDIKDKYDKILLIDVLHHIPKDEQKNTVKKWEQFGQVIIIESEGNLTAKLVDYLNDLRGMITPYAFRNQQGWQLLLPDYKVEKIKSQFWYPLNHLVMTR